MRAAIYARYSTELQRAASIEDQVRLCKTRIAAEGWSSAGVYKDAAVSGSIRLRPGYQKLLEDARAKAFDVVVAEALDRLSRDQEDVAALYKHLTFCGIKLITIGEGEITELHVGLKGTMNALFLKDLRQKVHRGLEGRVREGRSGGGLCYGYDVVREFDARGVPVCGSRRINDAEASIVRRIFEEFAAGRSPRAIAMRLNAERIPGPQGKSWGPSTIYGNWQRGTGILNNELYIGQLVWNRQRFIKDPTTGKRQARMNPPAQWVRQDVPELRIVSDALWKEAKARQTHVRRTLTHDDAGIRSERARRPVYLLSGLIKCGNCGGGFSIVSNVHYGCSTARNRGTCNNRLTIRRDVLEASVLSGLRTQLMEPELVKEFAAEYHRELNRLNAARDSDYAMHKQELVRVEAQIRAIIDAIKEGLRTPSMKDELLELERRKSELAAVTATAPPPAPRLHPKLAELYRTKIENLQAELNREELRAEAATALRSVIDEIRLVPENGHLEIELAGDLAGILAVAAGSKKPAMAGHGGLQLTLVAGTCNHRQFSVCVAV
jgi:DNA invertase Pin-like site-specific DNA recombinase